MTSEPCVLAVFAHPDDETLTAGGLLAVLARRCPVHLVTTNRGERGEVIPPDIAHLEGDHAELAKLRTKELSRAMGALGLTTQHYLDQLSGHVGPESYIDSGMQWAGESQVRALADPEAGPDAFSKADTDAVARVLAAHIRRLQPTLIITDEPNGGYGHPDHVHCSRVVSRAVQIAAADEQEASTGQASTGQASTERASTGQASTGQTPTEQATTQSEPDLVAATAPWRTPALAWVVRPAPVVRAAIRWLQEEPSRPRMTALGRSLQIGDPEGELPSIAVPAEEVDACIDTLEVAEQHLKAIRAYRSQAQDGALAPGSLAATAETTVPPASGAEAAASPGELVSPVPAMERPPTPTMRRPREAIGWFALSNEILQPIYARAWLRAADEWSTADELADVLGKIMPADHPAGRASSGLAPGQPAGTDEPAVPDPPGAADQQTAGAQGAPGWYLLLMAIFTVVMGVIFAATGTAFHRWTPPWGIVIALVALAAGGVLSRTFADMRGAVGYLVAVVVTVFAATWWRPGGDVLVTNQAIGYVWLLGSLVAGSFGALSPRRWFRDRA